MKFLGSVIGFLVACAIWVATFFIATFLVDKVSFDYRNAGVAGGLGLLGVGAFAGRRVWLEIEGHFAYLAIQAKRRRAAKRAALQQLLREKSQVHADQRGMESALHRRLETSQAMAAEFASQVAEAERFLDDAEQALVGGRYAPFWDAIHDAVLQLAAFNSHLETITRNARLYQKDAASLPTPPPPFTLDIKVPDYSSCIERLRAVLQLAQISHEFATFYELRKSGADQVPGFVSLSRAMNEMGARLDRSSEELSGALQGSGSESEESGAREILNLRKESPGVDKFLGRVSKLGT